MNDTELENEKNKIYAEVEFTTNSFFVNLAINIVILIILIIIFLFLRYFR
jgi:uncharacterized membrane protein YukC